jgi:acyl carrier protein
MDEHPLLPLLREIVLDVTGKPAPAISLTDDLLELGFDSVSVAEIVMRVEDALAIEIPATQWLEVRTLQGILELVDHRDPTLNSVSASSRTDPGNSGH